MTDGHARGVDAKSWALALAGLALTQIIGWGSTYYIPAVIDDRLSRDLSMSREFVFGGVTVMLVIGALAGPFIGRLIDRLGAGRILCLGSAVMALGLAVLSMSTGSFTYFAAWVLLGIGVPTGLTIPAIALLSNRAGNQARVVIGTLLLFTGMTATIAWPVTSWLTHLLGWRGMCIVFAILHIVVCLPIHLGLARSARLAPKAMAAATGPASAAADGIVPPLMRRAALILMALTFSLQGFVSWGLSLQLISVFEGFGMSTAIAVAIAALVGPAAVFARLIEVGLGHLVSPLLSMVIGSIILPVSFLILLAGTHDTASATAFVIIWSAGNGLVSIARATLPLALFGARGYGQLLGQLSLPQHMTFAIAPIVFAALIDRAGLGVSLWFAMLCELAACATLAALIMLTRGRPA